MLNSGQFDRQSIQINVSEPQSAAGYTLQNGSVVAKNQIEQSEPSSYISPWHKTNIHVNCTYLMTCWSQISNIKQQLTPELARSSGVLNVHLEPCSAYMLLQTLLTTVDTALTLWIG